jgi:hypothetical protein
MSTIYREAHLTIIAAAGSGPTHGLPGVEPCRRPGYPFRHELVESVRLSAFPTAAYSANKHLENINDSAWASRAWTFQEAMFSRRRLIFTEGQIIFNCNKTMCFEWPLVQENMRKDFVWSSPGVYKDSSDHVCMIIAQYCTRELSYEEDALNAIVSTLNLIQKSNEYHIWGVPFYVLDQCQVNNLRKLPSKSSSAALLGASDERPVELYLEWTNESGGSRKRRQQFPSWSPLGWNPGKIRFSGNKLHRYQGIVSISTPSGQKCLSTQTRLAKENPAQISPRISLVLRTAPVYVYKATSDPMQDEVALPLDQGLLVKIGKIKWDQPVEQSCELKIAQVDDDLRKENFRFLVLQKHTDRYERIGICISDWNKLKGLANINEVWQEWDRLDIGYYRHLLSAGTGLQTSGQDRTPNFWQRALIKWKRPKFDFIHVNENDMWGLVRASLKEEQVILA